MRITKASPVAVAYACGRFHYSHSVPQVTYAYNVWNDSDEWCGVVLYGYGATINISRPFDKWNGQVMELVRVALNGRQGHGRTSEAVAMTLKAIHREAPWVDLIVSYADLDQGHVGTLYQATNWVYIGCRGAGQRCAFVINGKKMHPKSVYSKGWRESILWLREHVDPKAEEVIVAGKHKYVYPMTKSMRARLSLISEEYPTKSVGIGG